jgi:hypothetical protein
VDKVACWSDRQWWTGRHSKWQKGEVS